MLAQWDSVDIARLEHESADEPMGTKEKFWIKLPGDDRPWLFKFARESGDAVLGEDWAEWLVHHLAGLVGVPTAVVRPARVDGHRGILSRSVLSSAAEELVHGNSVLSGHDPLYEQTVSRQNPRYTPEAVAAALAGVVAPLERPDLERFSGFDVWVSYLMLDALVAGRDRHHQNWAIVRKGNLRSLAPSFDHGNALGFAEPEHRLSRMVSGESQLGAWLNRGRSHHFAGKPTLVDLAVQALMLASSDSAEHWASRLEAITGDAAAAVVAQVPDEIMSEASRRFVSLLLDTNRRRLLDGYRTA